MTSQVRDNERLYQETTGTITLYANKSWEVYGSGIKVTKSTCASNVWCVRLVYSTQKENYIIYGIKKNENEISFEIEMSRSDKCSQATPVFIHYAHSMENVYGFLFTNEKESATFYKEVKATLSNLQNNVTSSMARNKNEERSSVLKSSLIQKQENEVKSSLPQPLVSKSFIPSNIEVASNPTPISAPQVNAPPPVAGPPQVKVGIKANQNQNSSFASSIAGGNKLKPVKQKSIDQPKETNSFMDEMAMKLKKRQQNSIITGDLPKTTTEEVKSNGAHFLNKTKPISDNKANTSMENVKKYSDAWTGPAYKNNQSDSPNSNYKLGKQDVQQILNELQNIKIEIKQDIANTKNELIECNLY
ncbi:hypothetical protein A3Q56_01024 [Intoshia linei]|uniref:WH1 domain-containing protein n=1 Tax=Intoshia linei TaxID=1819745 RepID=A0A177BC03_9BILA|nr:hypothetical protein A3Q56_01024 [Intoshia linei]